MGLLTRSLMEFMEFVTSEISKTRALLSHPTGKELAHWQGCWFTKTKKRRSLQERVCGAGGGGRAGAHAGELQYPSSAERAPAAPSNGLPGLPEDTGSGKLTREPITPGDQRRCDSYSLGAGPQTRLRVLVKLPTGLTSQTDSHHQQEQVC